MRYIKKCQSLFSTLQSFRAGEGMVCNDIICHRAIAEEMFLDNPFDHIGRCIAIPDPIRINDENWALITNP